jgi:site-specific DNA recombinase
MDELRRAGLRRTDGDACAGGVGAAEARDLLRSLVDSITLHPEGSGQRVGVRGELAAILGLASGGSAIKAGGSAIKAGGSAIKAGGSTDVLIEQIKMVAGARNTRFLRLVERAIPHLAAQMDRCPPV